MCIGGEALQSLSADPLGGGIRRYFLRMLRLQFLQAAVEHIVFIIADGGRVQHVVLVAVLIQRVPELFDLFTVIHGAS